VAETSETDGGSTKRRGPSISLLIVGLLALGVSVWAFIGPASMPASGVIPLGWIIVIAAIVVGVLLVLSPRKPN
jgi:FtsH-binding integral membrane protein